METSREKFADSFGSEWKMDSSGQSSGTNTSADLFQDLWRQLGECHRNALQELEAKVSKLKKDRYLDAQRLEVFYNRNQQLKEQNTSLQDAISLLEERLRERECDRCAILEENLKQNKDQNLDLVAKLKKEVKSLETENGKLHSELQKFTMSRSETKQSSSPELEEGIIPDSPIMPCSLPVANRLKRRKPHDEGKRLRYAEAPLPQSNTSLFCELVGDAKNPRKAEVLVPDTCELDAGQHILENENEEEVIAETCGLELFDEQHKKLGAAGTQKSSAVPPWINGVCLKPHCSSSSSTPSHSPDSTTKRSPSLLPRLRRFSEDGSICNVKQVKEEKQEEVPKDGQQGIYVGAETQTESKYNCELDRRSGASVASRSFKEESPENKFQVQLPPKETSRQRLNVSSASPVFKLPNKKVTGKVDCVGKNRTLVQETNETKAGKTNYTVENMWSIDPALALSMYDSELKSDEEGNSELVDTDCTWVSHSLLQRHRENKSDKENSISGLGEKANDSLDMMFDRTGCGEYRSFISSTRLCQTQPCDEQEEQEEEEDSAPSENSPCQTKAGQPTFAHVAVVRKKDERRKLKGTTCKECEIYYAHLPEEEKQKKLSACSRHRYKYIPPCTPENFWEVGFPSTQTCIERGYIREEKDPQARSRRRQPFNALFSPKQN
ncbi:DNA endonuclease RBBP8 [Pholidichthys leucotaenia]